MLRHIDSVDLRIRENGVTKLDSGQHRIKIAILFGSDRKWRLDRRIYKQAKYDAMHAILAWMDTVNYLSCICSSVYQLRPIKARVCQIHADWLPCGRWITHMAPSKSCAGIPEQPAINLVSYVSFDLNAKLTPPASAAK
jgi:hypothetical protein